jgi:hypothetical protein
MFIIDPKNSNILETRIAKQLQQLSLSCHLKVISKKQ